MAENENDVEELENQLHKQYAENDNNRIGVFTSFIVGIIALFAAYGYVYVNTNTNIRGNWNFNIQEFLLMSFVTMGILFFLALLALSLGYSLRRDHFIVYNIRKKRYKAKTKTKTETEIKIKEIFGEIYNPSDKCFCSFIPDFYNLFYWLFFSSGIFLDITIFIKINDNINTDNKFYNYKCILYIIFMLFHIFLMLKFRCCYYKKYEKAERQFKTSS